MLPSSSTPPIIVLVLALVFLLLPLPSTPLLLPSSLVVYTSASNPNPVLGCVCEYSVLQPLCTYDTAFHSSLLSTTPPHDDVDDDLKVSLVWDEDLPSTPLSSAVIKLELDPDDADLSARQVGGGQGLGNPHGEHCEDVYIFGASRLREILEGEGVGIRLVPERE